MKIDEYKGRLSLLIEQCVSQRMTAAEILAGLVNEAGRILVATSRQGDVPLEDYVEIVRHQLDEAVVSYDQYIPH